MVVGNLWGVLFYWYGFIYIGDVMKVYGVSLRTLFFTCLLGMFSFILVVGLFWGVDYCSHKYSIWSSRQRGLAELARAEGNREIAVCEARAARESAQCFADAEVTRARGVAEANKIIGDSLKGNEAYLRYRWIEGLQTNQMSVVYVPTEAGLPILEADRWSQTTQ